MQTRYTVTEEFRTAVSESPLPRYKLAALGGMLSPTFSNYVGGRLPFGPVVRQRIEAVGAALGLSPAACSVPVTDPVEPKPEIRR